jgi:hypothetical protein
MSTISEISEDLQRADEALRRIGVDAGSVAWGCLKSVGENPVSLAPVTALKQRAGLEGDRLERLLIWHAAQQSLPCSAPLPVDKAVRGRLERDLRLLHTMNASMAAGSYHFNRAAKMATLRRFSAGPLEWELSGIPRSWLLQASFPANLRLLAFVTFRLGGWAPCFVLHAAPGPRSWSLVLSNQVFRAYYRLARSMQLQPAVRALVGSAWFHDPAAVRDSPHLEALSQPYLDHGGLIVLLGPAPPSSGVLEGNAHRRDAYQSGKLQYRYGLAIWPRDAAIRWAEEHQEFGD